MRLAASLTAITATLLIAACGGGQARVSGPSDNQPRGPAGDYPMVLGAPFVVNGVTYTPADTMNYDSVGYAQIADNAGATEGVSGEHRTLPLPSYVEVTSLESGRTILVRLTDRGPMKGNDLIGLSPGAWAQLGLPGGSREPVRVRRTNPPENERAQLRAGAQVPARMDTPPGLLAALKRKLGLQGATAAVAAPALIPPKIVLPAKIVPPAKPAPAPMPAPKPTPEPKPAAKIAAKPVPPKSAPTPAASANGDVPGLYVQAGAYSDKARAEAAAKAIAGKLSQAGAVWRVRSGPYKDRGQADAALAKVRAAGYADARVVPAP